MSYMRKLDLAPKKWPEPSPGDHVPSERLPLPGQVGGPEAWHGASASRLDRGELVAASILFKATLFIDRLTLLTYGSLFFSVHHILPYPLFFWGGVHHLPAKHVFELLQGF